MKKHLLTASILLLAITSFGAGYQLNLQGLRELAMGGTGTAWPWDASTIFYNPGGLARLNGIQVYASGMVIMPNTGYGNLETTGSGTSANTQRQTFVPFNLYIGGPVQYGSRFALGLGIYTEAGIGLNWGNNWPGNYIVENIQLNAVCFQPTLSYRINDLLSVGAGFVYGIGSLDLTNALPVGGQAHLHGNATGAGFNLGVQMKVTDQLQLGFTYRSQINMGISGGSATFNSVPQSLQTSFPSTTFDSDLPLPQVASIGIGYRATDNLTLQFDLDYTGWNSFDSLHIDFAQNTSDLHNEHLPMHYRNTLTPRIGACYKISRMVSVMGGGAYDPTPVTNGFVSPMLPDADRIVLSCGASVKPLPRFTILAALEGVSSVKRTGTYTVENFSGTYKTEAVTTGVGIYYNF